MPTAQAAAHSGRLPNSYCSRSPAPERLARSGTAFRRAIGRATVSSCSAGWWVPMAVRRNGRERADGASRWRTADLARNTGMRHKGKLTAGGGSGVSFGRLLWYGRCPGDVSRGRLLHGNVVHIERPAHGHVERNLGVRIVGHGLHFEVFIV